MQTPPCHSEIGQHESNCELFAFILSTCCISIEDCWGAGGPAVNVTILRQPAGLNQPPAPLHPFVRDLRPNSKKVPSNCARLINVYIGWFF